MTKFSNPILGMCIGAFLLLGCGGSADKNQDSTLDQYTPRGECYTDYGMHPAVVVCKASSGNRDVNGIGAATTADYNLQDICARESAGGQCAQVKPATCTEQYSRNTCVATGALNTHLPPSRLPRNRR